MHLRRIYFSPVYMILEFLFFYVFVPFIAVSYLEGWFKIIPLLLIAAFFFLILRIDPHFDKRVLYRIKQKTP
jgi:uncharacterized protein